MKKFTIPVLMLFLSSPAYCRDDVAYPRKFKSPAPYQYLHVPTEYPTIQSAVDAAVLAGGDNLTILVEAGEYRESIVVTGLKNLNLMGTKARILPPADFHCTEPPADDSHPVSSFKLVNCENFKVDGFTFIGDDFAEGILDSYPMGTSILSVNSSGTISNNIIFNYFDGICFMVNNLKWMKGDITNNYIHNCLWSGIFATGSHNLTIQKNKIVFTIPKTLSIAVGIWTYGGIGIISGNHITSYMAVDDDQHQKTISEPDLWPSHFEFNEQLDYQVSDNTFEQSQAGVQFNKVQMAAGTPHGIQGRTLRVHNHFVNASQGNDYHDPVNLVIIRSK